MDHQPPVSYKNFLPSKRLVIIMTVLIIGVVIITVAPILIRRYKESQQPQPPAVLELTTLTGDPTTRDSDRDGIYDWQEIAVGLNPAAAETTPGVSDEISFETITNNLSPETQELFKTSSDSTIISYTIYKNALALSSGGAIDDESLSEAAQQELRNYMLSFVPSEKYTSTNLPRKPSTPEYDAEYLAITKKLPTVDLFSLTTQQLIGSYVTTGANKSDIVKKIDEIRSVLALFEKIPVPESIFEEQREVLNALHAIATLLENYDPTNTDDVYSISYKTLLQSYQVTLIKKTISVFTYYKDSRAELLQQVLQNFTNLQ